MEGKPGLPSIGTVYKSLKKVLCSPTPLVDAQYCLAVVLMVLKSLPTTPAPFFVPVTEPYEHSEPLHQVEHGLKFVPRHEGQSQPRLGGSPSSFADRAMSKGRYARAASKSPFPTDLPLLVA